MNFANSSLWNFGSGNILRCPTTRLLGILILRYIQGLPKTVNLLNLALLHGNRYFLGRLTPYLERPCFLPFTPEQSSAPRMV